MIAKLVPVIIMLVGLGIGVGAGFLLKPAPAADDGAHATEGEAAHGEEKADDHETAADSEHPPEFVKLNNQFVVPVLENGRIVSMVMLSLSLEVTTGSTPATFAVEPKLRDEFLQVLFDHANAGGFRGSFTDAANLVTLRRALTEVGKGILKDKLVDVLITDIARQDA